MTEPHQDLQDQDLPDQDLQDQDLPPDVEAGDRPSATRAENPAPPETGDIVIDAALRELAAAPPDDLDAQLRSGEAVHRTLQSRLSDLGG